MKLQLQRYKRLKYDKGFTIAGSFFLMEEVKPWRQEEENQSQQL